MNEYTRFTVCVAFASAFSEPDDFVQTETIFIGLNVSTLSITLIAVVCVPVRATNDAVRWKISMIK